MNVSSRRESVFFPEIYRVNKSQLYLVIAYMIVLVQMHVHFQYIMSVFVLIFGC